MKIKLFGNAAPSVIPLTLMSGGYDVDQGQVLLIVRGEGGVAGTISLGTAEARRLSEMLMSFTPGADKEPQRIVVIGSIKAGAGGQSLHTPIVQDEFPSNPDHHD